MVAAPPSVTYRAAKFVGRHRTPVLATSVAALVAVLGTAMYIHGIRSEKSRTEDALKVAEVERGRAQESQNTAEQESRRARLRDEEQYVGGYDQVRRYVAAKRGRQRETFLPLSYEPGQRAESDFGQIWVDFPEGRSQVPILLVTWAYSNATFMIALPSEQSFELLRVHRKLQTGFAVRHSR